MSGPVVAVGAIVRHGDGLLLIERAHDPGKGLWSVPGGRVQRHESLHEAVERELEEETGLIGRCGAFIGFAERRGTDHHFVILDFAVAVDDIEPLQAQSDAVQARFFSRDEMAALPLVDGLLDFVDHHDVFAS